MTTASDVKTPGASLTRDELLRLYETMALIRAFDQRFAALVALGTFSGVGHRYVGREAGDGRALRQGHGHVQG